MSYAGHYANAAGNLNLELKKGDEDDAPPGETKGSGGFRRYSWAELLALFGGYLGPACKRSATAPVGRSVGVSKVRREDGTPAGRCADRSGNAFGLEESREFLKSINRLGYPPRPPPVPLAGRNWPQESLEDGTSTLRSYGSVLADVFKRDGALAF